MSLCWSPRWILQLVQELSLLPGLLSCIREVRVYMQACELGWSQVHCHQIAFLLLAVLGSVKLCLALNVMWHWWSGVFDVSLHFFLQSPVKATALWRDRGCSEQCHCTPWLALLKRLIHFLRSQGKKKITSVKVIYFLRGRFPAMGQLCNDAILQYSKELALTFRRM